MQKPTICFVLLLAILSCKTSSQHRNNVTEANNQASAQNTNITSAEPALMPPAPVTGATLLPPSLQIDEVHQGKIAYIKVTAIKDVNADFTKMWVCERGNTRHCNPSASNPVESSNGEFYFYQIPASELAFYSQSCADTKNSLPAPQNCSETSERDFISTVSVLNNPTNTTALLDIQKQQGEIRNACNKMHRDLQTYLNSNPTDANLKNLAQNQINVTDPQLCAQFMASPEFDTIEAAIASNGGAGTGTGTSTAPSRTINTALGVGLGSLSVLLFLASAGVGYPRIANAIENQGNRASQLQRAIKSQKEIEERLINLISTITEKTNQKDLAKKTLDDLTAQHAKIETDKAEIQRKLNLPTQIADLKTQQEELIADENKINVAISDLHDMMLELHNQLTQNSDAKRTLESEREALNQKIEKYKTDLEALNFNSEQNKMDFEVKQAELTKKNLGHAKTEREFKMACNGERTRENLLAAISAKSVSDGSSLVKTEGNPNEFEMVELYNKALKAIQTELNTHPETIQYEWKEYGGFEGPKTRRDALVALKENLEKNQELNYLVTQYKLLIQEKTEIESLEKGLADLQKKSSEFQVMQSAQAVATTRVDDINTELAKREEARIGRNAEILSVRQKIKTKDHELEGAKKSAGQNESEIHKLQSELAQLFAENQAAFANLKSAQASLDFEKAQIRLAQTPEQAEAAFVAANRDLSITKSQIRQLMKFSAAKHPEKAVSYHEEQVAKANTRLSGAKTGTTAALVGSLLTGVGALAATVAPSMGLVGSAENELADSLDGALTKIRASRAAIQNDLQSLQP